MNLRASFGSVKLTVKIRAFEVQSVRGKPWDSLSSECGDIARDCLNMISRVNPI